MHFVIPHSFQEFATHTKRVPHPLSSGYYSTAAAIGPIGGGAIVAAPVFVYNPPQIVEQQLIQYSANTGVPVSAPLKLFFTRFPPFIEAIVQRIQNYYSTYNHVGNENVPASPPKNKPAPPNATDTTTLSPESATNETRVTDEEPTTVTETPTTVTDTQLSNNLELVTGKRIEGKPNCDDSSTAPSFSEQEETSTFETSVANIVR
jgi:hypothetical protein